MTGVLSRRAMVVGGSLALASAAAYAAKPRRSENRLAHVKLAKLIPAAIGPWRYADSEGVVVARADDAAPVDGYDQVVARTYAAPGLPAVMLMLAYGSTQGGSLQLHRPETCYPGQGFVLHDFAERGYRFAGSRDVATRSFTAYRDDRIERVLYWTRIGDRYPLNTAGMYAAILKYALAGLIADGILVRVSTVEAGATDRPLAQFLETLVQAAPPAGRQILLG